MGKIVLVSATPLEHGGLKDINGAPIFQVGIGKTNAAMNMTKIILEEEPDIVVNFGSCGNLSDFKVGDVIEVGTVCNNIDVRPFSDYGCTPESDICDINLSKSEVRCFSTDQIYDNTRSDYAEKYKEMIKTSHIVDMECYPLAYVCTKFNIPFYSYKWVSDNGDVDTWEQNASIGFENFRTKFLEHFYSEY